MKHLISTYCNRFKGDFLINHWLLSLKKHVNLDNTDILIIDFGLTDKQRQVLLSQGIMLMPADPYGRMSNIQYQYLSGFLQKNPHYDQVLYSDCGDIIFQDDISHLFNLETSKFKAVPEEEFNYRLHKITLGISDVRKDKLKMIEAVLQNKSTVNCGFIIGPAAKFVDIWPTYNLLCKDVKIHGTDQLIINYILYKEGFIRIAMKFNFVTFLNKDAFFKNANSFFENAEGIIPVVHNAGKYDFARRISDFGYQRGVIKSRKSALFFIYSYRLLNKLAGIFN